VRPIGEPRLVIARVSDLPAPTSAIDQTALADYVKRVGAGRPAALLQARGLGGWRAEIDARDGDQVVLRQAYDSGWHATVDGRTATVRADPIGQLVLDVPAGHHVVELSHGVHSDFIAGVALAAATALAWLGFAFRRRGARA